MGEEHKDPKRVKPKHDLSSLPRVVLNEVEDGNAIPQCRWAIAAPSAHPHHRIGYHNQIGERHLRMAGVD
jgi:hypothetical protein